MKKNKVEAARKEKLKKVKRFLYFSLRRRRANGRRDERRRLWLNLQ